MPSYNDEDYTVSRREFLGAAAATTSASYAAAGGQQSQSVNTDDIVFELEPSTTGNHVRFDLTADYLANDSDDPGLTIVDVYGVDETDGQTRIEDESGSWGTYNEATDIVDNGPLDANLIMDSEYIVPTAVFANGQEISGVIDQDDILLALDSAHTADNYRGSPQNAVQSYKNG